MRSPRRVRMMAPISLAAAAVACSVAAGPAEEMDRLQGSWKLVREHMWSSGDRKVGVGTWVINGNTLTQEYSDTTVGTIKLDPTHMPGRFERTRVTNGNEPGSKFVGTYRLEGDTLKFYMASMSRDEPPTDFPEGPASGHHLEVWKRVGRPTGDGLDGEWKAVATYVFGMKNIQLPKQEKIMNVRGGDYRTQIHSRWDNLIIKIDPSKDPKQIDITYVDDPFLNMSTHTSRCVYWLDGDRLTVWEGTVWEGIGKRPTEADDGPDSRQRFRVFEKVKP
jgi:uncharacterized protein (TIGR03067 family)